MAGIQEYLDLIKNAIYGKDVRQAIHDGIEQCYKDGKAGSIDLEARARIDEFTHLAEGSTTGDAELIDGRTVGGITYSNIGGAIRSVNDDVKGDLESAQDDGLYHRYLTWEHGGIDNATGANNNEGSLVRSRMPEYLLCSDYEKVTNDTSDLAYVIYYDENKTFQGSSACISTSPVTIDKVHTYFRIDMRASIDLTYHIRVYQKFKTPNLRNDVQIYFDKDRAIIEEDATNKKIYFNTGLSLYVRYGINGTRKINRSLDTATIATEVGASLVTSPSGATNCIAIDDEYALVFDIDTYKFALVHRYSLSNNHIPVIVQSSGIITYAHQGVQKVLYRNGNREIFYAQIYFYEDNGKAYEWTSINHTFNTTASI